MNTNLILNTDSYKASHYLQYPPCTTRVSSYIESRGGEYDRTVFFGLQMFLKEYLTKPITQGDIDEAEAILKAHGLPFNREGWEHILHKHRGYLPLEIQAVPEGAIVPTHNVLVQVVNTDPACFWLTSYVETALLRAVWYPTTVATRSWHCKQTIRHYLEITADSIETLPFKLHDFGARGASSEETAALGGAAHIVNFKGSDNLSGILAARRYYGADMPAFSIPAAEHSTLTAWGKDHEAEAYANMLKRFAGPGKIVAVVSDSYDLWHAIDSIWGEQLKKEIETSGGTLVIRPDSGDPATVVGEALSRLSAKFGYRLNKQGFRVLPDYIRLIQGDGVSPDSIAQTLHHIWELGYSTENVTFGMGGELLQKINRDTLRFAMKASAVEIDGHWHDIHKDPVTDHGKRSKRGRLTLVRRNDTYETIPERESLEGENQLVTVFRNGQILKSWTLEEICQCADSSRLTLTHPRSLRYTG